MASLPPCSRLPDMRMLSGDARTTTPAIATHFDSRVCRRRLEDPTPKPEGTSCKRAKPNEVLRTSSKSAPKQRAERGQLLLD